MQSGAPDGQSSAYSSEKLNFLTSLISTFSTSESGEISIEDVHAHLLKSHSLLPSAKLQASLPTLSLLIRAHASFPFPRPALLNLASLVRALALLTSSTNAMFAQSAGLSGAPAIRPRSVTAKMEFLFSVLARPDIPTGVPTKDDVLDVLCRIPYPFSKNPSVLPRMTISSLEPMAERLLQTSTEIPSRQDLRVDTETLRPLADLCNVMRKDSGAAAESVLQDRESLTKQEFIQWAQAVSKASHIWLLPRTHTIHQIALPRCLDSLFCVFFLPTPEVKAAD